MMMTMGRRILSVESRTLWRKHNQPEAEGVDQNEKDPREEDN